jgi:hypothetical protein
MNRVCWLFVSMIVVFGANAQTSRSEKTGFWTTGASWVGGTMPGTLAGATVTVTSQTVVVNGRIQSTKNITLNLSNLSINAGDTLIILGNLTITSSLFSNNGVLIVFGNVSNTLSNSVISGSGKMVVTGNYSNALGSNTFTGPSYVYGSTSGFIFSPPVEDQADLQSDDPGLYSYVNSTYVALPVTLISFTAVENEGDVRINWVTASELNNDYFLIERSKDGVHFSTLTKVDGAGTTKTETRYEAIDDRPFVGRSYYRLRQVDFDTKTTFFNVITVYTNEPALVEPYPNPTTDYLYFDVEAGKYSINVSDLNGVLMHSSFISTETETGRLALHMNDLEAGTYIVHLINKTSSSRASYKVVKK